MLEADTQRPAHDIVPTGGRGELVSSKQNKYQSNSCPSAIVVLRREVCLPRINRKDESQFRQKEYGRNKTLCRDEFLGSWFD